MVNELELRRTISEVEKDCGYSLSFDFAKSAVEKVSEKYKRMKFHEALRYGLNELHCPSSKRSGYAKIVGKILGRRGGRKNATRSRKSPPPPAQKTPSSKTGEVIEETSGQFAFLI